MSPKLTVRSAAGTRDFLPEEMALRNRVKAIIEESFSAFGFLPLETPSLERLEILTDKYGDGADRLIFKILKRGDELERGKESGELCDLALRYDLTVPLARVVAMNRGKLIFPFKRYQIQPVWRAERQQRGRYREFVQCDADIVGTASVSADAEIIALTDDILKRLGMPGYKICVNHRMLLQSLITTAGIGEDRFSEACIAVDKLDKIGWDGVQTELDKRNFSAETIDKLVEYLDITGDPDEILEKIEPLIGDTENGGRGITETRQLFYDLSSMGIPADRLQLNLYLARGLDYYTGPIFETIIEEPRIGSITGGGRYDNLIGMFSGEHIPATGTTIGIERIFDVIRELHLFDDATETPVKVMVAVFSEETRSESLKIAAELRGAGIPTDVYFDTKKKLGKQFAYADRRKIPFVVVAGPDEIDRGEVTLKNLTTGEQQTIGRKQLISLIPKV